MAIKSFLSICGVAICNVRRQKLSSFCILFPLSFVIAVFSSFLFFRDGLLKDSDLASEVLPDLVVQSLVGGRAQSFSMSKLHDVCQLEGVSRVVPRVWGYVPVTHEGTPFTFTLVGFDPSIDPSPFGEIVGKGRMFKPGETGVAVAGSILSSFLKVTEGDSVAISDDLGNSDKFHITGIFSSAVQIYSADIILVPLECARNHFGFKSDEISDLGIYLSDPTQAGVIASRIQSSYKGVRVISKNSIRTVIGQAYGSRTGFFQLAWTFLLLTVILCIFSQGANAGFHVRREIGILRAVGWGTIDVIALKAVEVTFLSFAAAVLGMTLGITYIKVGAPGIKGYFMGWAEVFPPFSLPLYISVQSVVQIVVLGVLPLLAATVIPSWLVCTADCDEAIR